MTYAEAMRRYGSDKPDLRIPLELTEVTDLVRDCEFKVFATPAQDPGGRVAALRVPGGGALARSAIDEYTAFVARYGAKGLAYIKVNERAARPRGPAVADHQVPGRRGARRASSSAPDAADNDLIFFGADRATVVNDALGALRLKIGQDLKLS